MHAAGKTAMCQTPGPRLDRFLKNLTRPVGFGVKIRLVIANTLRKIFSLRTCCGRPGQPGC
jgi:hypothetical protein